MMNSIMVEYLGTLFFLMVILVTGNAYAIGLALTIAILLGCKISGGNFNPAVSIMMFVAGKLPEKKVGYYIMAQILGGLTAIFLYKNIKNYI